MSAKKDFNVKWGMAIDLDKCTGCGACMVACQAENNLAPVADASNKLRVMNWLVVFELSNKKPFPIMKSLICPALASSALNSPAPRSARLSPRIATRKAA